MNRYIWFIVLLAILLAGCLARDPEAPPTAEAEVPLDQLVAAALAETQQASVADFSPILPYSPLELAELLVPGNLLEGAWQPSTVYDLSYPHPKISCREGYYGSCWNDWPGAPFAGAELSLLSGGEERGKAAFLYYEDLEDIETIYQAFNTRWTASKADEGESYNDIWLNFSNALDTSDLGEKSQNNRGYFLVPPEDREMLIFRIEFFRCHGYVHIELEFIPETNYQADDKETRLEEQAAFFELVHEYARLVDERITPYACNP